MESPGYAFLHLSLTFCRLQGTNCLNLRYLAHQAQGYGDYAEQVSDNQGDSFFKIVHHIRLLYSLLPTAKYHHSLGETLNLFWSRYRWQAQINRVSPPRLITPLLPETHDYTSTLICLQRLSMNIHECMWICPQAEYVVRHINNLNFTQGRLRVYACMYHTRHQLILTTGISTFLPLPRVALHS